MRTEICAMSAETAVSLVKKRELSAVELTGSVLEQIEAIDDQLLAFRTVDRDGALATARAVDERIARGESVGALAGLPVSVKDLIFTKGLRTSGGSRAYSDFVPTEDDIAVARLRAADAIIIGKTTVPEFGYSATGINMLAGSARNPWDLERTPGGSSSGSGVAVATGMGPVSLGSDGGGSVRIPASFCGIFGMKPSMGRIPLYPSCRDTTYPGFSSWESLEHLGVLSRTVGDAALMLSVVVGPDGRDRHSLPLERIDWGEAAKHVELPLKVVYSEDWGYAPVDPVVRSVTRDAVRVLADALSWEVEEAHPGWSALGEVMKGLIIASTDRPGMRRLASTIGEENISPHIMTLLNEEWSQDDLVACSMVRDRVVAQMASLMERCDIVVTPTLGVEPFGLDQLHPDLIEGRRVGEFDALIGHTAPMNMTGQPAASVPVGWSKDGLPIGLQIIGPHLGDAKVLSVAASVEQVLPWADRWPEISQIGGAAAIGGGSAR